MYKLLGYHYYYYYIIVKHITISSITFIIKILAREIPECLPCLPPCHRASASSRSCPWLATLIIIIISMIMIVINIVMIIIIISSSSSRSSSSSSNNNNNNSSSSSSSRWLKWLLH